MRPRAGVRAGALASSWPCAGARPFARPLARSRPAPKMGVVVVQREEDAAGAAKRPGRRGGPGRLAPRAALPADAEGAPQLQAYTTDRTPDSEPKLVAAADVDSHRSLRAQPWPPKSSLYLFRTDGMSCSRELVTGSGQLRFAHPSTQQHLLVWRERPRSVMVLKKRGPELAGEFVQVVRYLGETERLRVVVEPAEYDALLLAAQFGGGGGGGGGGASAANAHDHADPLAATTNPLAASSRYLYTFTPQERERGLADAVDFVVCLGGDGVILHAGGLFGRSIPPVVSFHLGSMGFLTNHDFADFRSHLRDVIYGSERLEACSGEALAAPVEGAGAAAAAAAAVSPSTPRTTAPVSPRPDASSFSNGASGSSSNGALSPQQPQHAQAAAQQSQAQAAGGQMQKLGVMVTLRMRLECSVVRRGADRPEQVYEVLNEVVVDRGADSFLTNLECRVAGRLITRVQADGVMLATASGSTAYSAAAGGSMVHPNVPSILLTPVCPHSLNFRPVVLPDYVELELRVPDAARAGAWVCFDGKHRQQLGRGDSVHVRMSPNPMPTINKADLTGDWFESLERCFRWSNRAEQKPLLEGARAGVAAEADSSNQTSRDDGDAEGGGAASDDERAEQRARRKAEAEAMARAFAYAAAMEPGDVAAAPGGGSGVGGGGVGGGVGGGGGSAATGSWDGGVVAAPGTPTQQAGSGGGGGGGGGLGSSVPVSAYYGGPSLQQGQGQPGQQQQQQGQPGSPPPARALSPFAWTPLPPMPPPPGDW